MSHNTISVFEGEVVQNLHQQALAAWMNQISANISEGWSKSSIDIGDVLAVFSCLSLKLGLRLQGYQFRSGRDGNGIVWAVPNNSSALSHDDCEDNDCLENPPHPNGALTHVMEAIDGDGSAWSYLCASIFFREIIEFGAIGHGSSWSTVKILNSNPLLDIHSGETSYLEEQTSKEPSQDIWSWHEPPPEEWNPTVVSHNYYVVVTFYAYCDVGVSRIIRYVDTYRQGQYCCETDEFVSATSSSGWVY